MSLLDKLCFKGEQITGEEKVPIVPFFSALRLYARGFLSAENVPGYSPADADWVIILRCSEDQLVLMQDWLIAIEAGYSSDNAEDVRQLFGS